MASHFYRGHRCEVSEDGRFWEAAVHYGPRTQNLYAWVMLGKAASPTDDDILAACRRIVDEKALDDEGRRQRQ